MINVQLVKVFLYVKGRACPLYYLKRGKARCMKCYSLQEKELLLKIADLQGVYNLTLHL